MSQAVRKQADFEEEVKSAQAQEATAGLREYVGIFLTAAAVLLLELAFTRVFAVVLWAHLAFMVVSTALFGFGLSGAYLALRPQVPKGGLHRNLSLLALGIAISIVASYLVVTNVPFQMWQFQENPLNFLYLGVWYVALIGPFFFAGLIIARLLKHYSKSSSRLYGVDLVGAGVGSLLLVPFIGRFGGEGTMVLAALLAIAAGFSFLRAGDTLNRNLLIAAGLGLLIALPIADEIFPLKLHQNKRRFNQALKHEHLISTRWSPLSRVDVSYHRKGLHDIWIDGGTNESVIIQWSGDMEKLKPQTWSSIGAVYDLKQGSNPDVLIIGPAGGKEVLFALSYGVNNIDAVEMDPSIVALVNEPKHANYMGNLYQKEQVNLVNDEGRSYLRRQDSESYDVIQIINNYTPVAIASGALNLSSAFLLTKEAFEDFLDKLRPEGVLALHRGATLRLAITAMSVLSQQGVEDPAGHILISAGEVPYFDGFFLKKTPWTAEEVDKVYEYLKHRPRTGSKGKVFFWNPVERDGDTLYHKVMNTPPEQHVQYHTKLGVNLFPPTDNQPFVEHFLQFGKKELSPELPYEYRRREQQKWRGIIPRGDFPYVAILVESILLSLLFVVAPLFFFAGSSIKTKNFSNFLGYFCCLGFAFIVIEICLMKKYVLFLGNPAYSITTVLVVILCGAGFGSLAAAELGKRAPAKAATWAISAVVGVLLLELLFSPMVFEKYLALSFPYRIAVATAMLLPVGFVMGMPFPLGLQQINQAVSSESEQQKITAWAWGVNGYMTVVGSASTIFLALFAGFQAALLLGTLVYLVAAFFIRKTRID